MKRLPYKNWRNDEREEKEEIEEVIEDRETEGNPPDSSSSSFSQSSPTVFLSKRSQLTNPNRSRGIVSILREVYQQVRFPDTDDGRALEYQAKLALRALLRKYSSSPSLNGELDSHIIETVITFIDACRPLFQLLGEYVSELARLDTNKLRERLYLALKEARKLPRSDIYLLLRRLPESLYKNFYLLPLVLAILAIYYTDKIDAEFLQEITRFKLARTMEEYVTRIRILLEKLVPKQEEREENGEDTEEEDSTEREETENECDQSHIEEMQEVDEREEDNDKLGDYSHSSKCDQEHTATPQSVTNSVTNGEERCDYRNTPNCDHSHKVENRGVTTSHTDNFSACDFRHRTEDSGCDLRHTSRRDQDHSVKCDSRHNIEDSTHRGKEHDCDCSHSTGSTTSLVLAERKIEEKSVEKGKEEEEVRVSLPVIGYRYGDSSVWTCKCVPILFFVDDYDKLVDRVGQLFSEYCKVHCSQAVKEAIERGVLPIVHVLDAVDSNGNTSSLVLLYVEYSVFGRELEVLEKRKKKVSDRKKDRAGLSDLDNMPIFEVPLYRLEFDKSRIYPVDMYLLARLKNSNKEEYRRLYEKIIQALRQLALLQAPPLPVEETIKLLRELFGENVVRLVREQCRVDTPLLGS